MSNIKSNNDSEEIDFVTKPLFQQSIKKAKRKQTMKFIIIGSMSTLIILFALYQGTSYMLQKRIGNDDEIMLYSRIKGANVYNDKISYDYRFLSLLSRTTTSKYIGGQEITWNYIEEEVTAFERKNIDNFVSVENRKFSERLDRTVLYNDFNGEKEVDFYYPQIEYAFLPDELSITTDIDGNMLIEVALSFDKDYSIKEVNDIMGTDNVTWLWVNTATQENLNKLSDTQSAYLSGPSANGFQVYGGEYISAAEEFLENIQQLSKGEKYQATVKKMVDGINNESFPNNTDIRITGAVVTGTPEELDRFKDLGVVRASTIGATIDLY